MFGLSAFKGQAMQKWMATAMATRTRLGASVMVGVAVASTAACSKPDNVNYGDPVGIQIDAKGTVPAIDIAVAVTKGRDVTPAVSSLAGSVYAAASACPAFVTAVNSGKLVRLRFTAEAGVLHPPAQTPTEEAGSCMIHALDGKPVTMDKPDKLDVLVEMTKHADTGSRH
jgi:hypothetical protein